MASSPHLDYQSELVEIWQNKRFSDTIAAKVYDGTNIRGSELSSNKPLLESKAFLACVIEHSKCSGLIVTENYTHRCFCPCHRFLVFEEAIF
jgi:hypothetical protein